MNDKPWTDEKLAAEQARIDDMARAHEAERHRHRYRTS